MKRTVNVTLKFSMVIDNDRESLPYVTDPSKAVLDGFKAIDGLIEIKPGATLAMRFDRESWSEIRRRDRIRRVNAKR